MAECGKACARAPEIDTDGDGDREVLGRCRCHSAVVILLPNSNVPGVMPFARARATANHWASTALYDNCALRCAAGTSISMAPGTPMAPIAITVDPDATKSHASRANEAFSAV